MLDVGDWVDSQYLVLERRRGRRWINYIALDRISENVFVIKRPANGLYPDAFSPEDLMGRAQDWIALGECEGCVNAYLIKEFESVPHLFLQYMDGPSIGDVLNARPGKPLPINQAVDVMKQLISGIRVLHTAYAADGSLGLIHGNLTTRNIFFGHGNIRITDIGLSSVFRDFEGMVGAGFFQDSLPYMAPEQTLGAGEADIRADVYSFGAVMYEMATGTTPPIARRSGDSMVDMVGSGPPSPRLRNHLCPRWLEETILKCMAQVPDNRFQNFEQIGALVTDVLKAKKTTTASGEDQQVSTRSSRVARVRGVAKKESSRLDHHYIGVEHLMLGLLAEEEGIVVSTLGDRVTAEKLRSKILAYLPKGEGPWHWKGMKKTPRYKRVMKLARGIRKEDAEERMLPQHILLAILLEGRNVPVRILRKLSVDVGAAAENLRDVLKRRTPVISLTGTDTEMLPFAANVSFLSDSACPIPFVGRRSELERARTLLLDDGKSIMVVGEPGVGKTAFALQLENLVTKTGTDAGPGCGGMLKLQIPTLIERSEDADRARGNFIETINEIADAGSIMLIEHLPVLLELGVRISPHAVTEAIEECLVSKNLLMVATATLREYGLCESEHERLLGHMEVINLHAPTEEETLEILRAARELFEREHSAKISDDALTAALNLSGAVGKHRALPAGALDLLEQACVTAKLSSYADEKSEKTVTVTAEHVGYATDRTHSGE